MICYPIAKADIWVGYLFRIICFQVIHSLYRLKENSHGSSFMSSISGDGDDASCFVLLKDELKGKKDEFSKDEVLLLGFLFFETL